MIACIPDSPSVGDLVLCTVLLVLRVLYVVVLLGIVFLVIDDGCIPGKYAPVTINECQ